MQDVNFVMLVGIPASGKTTVANRLVKSDGFLKVSSDDLREDLFGDVNCQDRNVELFQEAHKRIINLLKEGKSVVFDATNLNSKKRKALISQLPKGVLKTCIFCSVSIDESIERDSKRDRVVGKGVISRMYRRAQIPMYKENWDSIILYSPNYRYDNKKDLIMPNTYEEYKHFLTENNCCDCVDLPQDTPYHTLSVSRHMYYAYDNIKDTDREDVKIALLLHDIGKGYTKEYNGKYASFRGHESVSAQMAIEVLKNFSISEKRIIRIATLIQLHMMMHNKEWGSKNREKFKKEVGESMWEDLIILNNCDTMAK